MKYAEEGVSVTLGDNSPQVVARETAAEDDQLDLPEGVVDPRKKLAEIYRKSQGGRRQ